MSRRRSLERGAVVGLLLGVVALAACEKSATQVVLPAAEDELAGIEPTPPSDGSQLAARRAKVRVYADLGYRAGVSDWKAAVRSELRRASDILEPTLGLRLELEATLSWQRSEGDDLDAALVEIEALDPGADVDLVLALVEAPTEPAPVALAELGRSRWLGHHLVVRGVAGRAEGSTSHAALVRLLHHFGDLLGAPHARDGAHLDAANYTTDQRRFSEPTAALMRAVLPRWLARETDAATEAARLALAEPHDAWRDADRARLLDALAIGAAAARGWDPPPPGADLRPADREAYKKARGLAEAGELQTLRSVLAPVIEFHPDDAAALLLDCRAADDLGASDAVAVCDRAAVASDGHIAALLHRAHARATGGELDAAVAEVSAARARLVELDIGEPRAWQLVASVYKDARRVSDVEAVIERAGDAGPELARWASELRARFAMPRSVSRAGVEPADEPVYLAAIEGALRQVYAGDWGRAHAATRALERRFPGTPAPSLLDCEIAFRKQEIAAATKHCDRAIAAAPDSSWPHYLLGLIARHQGRNRYARNHLERAIDLDPGLEHAYRVLGALVRGKDAAALRDLEERYQARFDKPLR